MQRFLWRNTLPSYIVKHACPVLLLCKFDHLNLFIFVGMTTGLLSMIPHILETTV